MTLKSVADLPNSQTAVIKAKFHYAIWSQTGPKLVADRSEAGRRLLARTSSLL